MTKTRREVVAMAHRRIGVLATDEALTADQYAYGTEALAGVLDEVQAGQGITYAWAADEVPDSLFLPLSYLLAVDMAPHYEVQPRDSRSAMIARLRTQAFPDDREDRRDLDEDSTVTDAEIAADERAQYY